MQVTKYLICKKHKRTDEYVKLTVGVYPQIHKRQWPISVIICRNNVKSHLRVTFKFLYRPIYISFVHTRVKSRQNN